MCSYHITISAKGSDSQLFGRTGSKNGRMKTLAQRVLELPPELQLKIFSILPADLQTLCKDGHIIITEDRVVHLPRGYNVRVFAVNAGGHGGYCVSGDSGNRRSGVLVMPDSEKIQIKLGLTGEWTFSNLNSDVVETGKQDEITIKFESNFVRIPSIPGLFLEEDWGGVIVNKRPPCRPPQARLTDLPQPRTAAPGQAFFRLISCQKLGRPPSKPHTPYRQYDERFGIQTYRCWQHRGDVYGGGGGSCTDP